MARATHNLDGWNAAGHRYPEVDASVARFEAGLRAQFPTPSVVEESLISSAVSLHAAILLTQTKMLAAHSRLKRTGPLYMNLPTLTSNLLRTLRALRLVDRDDDDAPSGETLESYVARLDAAKAKEAAVGDNR